MKLSRKPVLCLLAGVWLCVTGCATQDPFGEMQDTPSGPSTRYHVLPEHPPAVAPPGIVPDLDRGPLTLADCVVIALANSPRTGLSWETTQATAALVGQARSLYLPQADFTGLGQRQKYLAQTDVGGENKYRRTRRTASFGVRQLLLDGGGRRANVLAAEAALLSADLRHNALLLDLALETEISYYRLLAAQSLLVVAEETVRQRTWHLELADLRLTAGRGRPLEGLQARADRDAAELAVVETRHQVRTMRGQLASIMGLPVSSPLEIVEIPEEAREFDKQDVERLMKEAAVTRPLLQAAIAEVERARQGLLAQEAARWPEVNASAAFGWADWHTPPNEEDEWSLAFNLSLPLFTGFQRTYRIRQAKAEYRAAVHAYGRALKDVELDVWEAYSGILRAEEALKAADTFVESARETVRVSKREYEGGRATIVELIDAQTVLTSALNRRATTRLDWYLAVSRVERTVGRSFDRSFGQSPGQARTSAGTSTAAEPVEGEGNPTPPGSPLP